MIIEQTQISKTLIIFLEVESLKTGYELENDFEEFQELVNSAGAEIVDKSYSKQSKPSISHFINKGKIRGNHCHPEFDEYILQNSNRS